RHRSKVQGHFDQVFAAPQAEDESNDDQLLADLWLQELEGEAATAILDNSGFADSQVVIDQLAAIRNSHTVRGMGVRGRERLDQLMPLLLEAVGGCDGPEVTLKRVLKLIESIGKRTAYLALLVENPIALSQLVRLAGISPWITQQLERHPLLMDELLDPRRLFSPLRESDLKDELNILLTGVDGEDLEQQMERLRQFSQSNILRVASADLTGVIPLMVVSDYLTDIAEVVVDRVMRLVWEHMTAKHGKPTQTLGEENGFAVIGYGKLGGIELGYGSDLDLVFMHGSQSATAMTDGERQVANDLFYARLGQRMIHMFTTRTPSGLLYEIDMRLRPNGNSGMLVTSVDAFERYQHNDAWIWEHQALLRARAVAGDPAVIARFEQVRRDVLSQPRDVDELRQAVREMREKMRESLDKTKAGQFDIKQGRGGIADIEFMVQYCVLRWASQYPDLLDWTDNVRLLESLEKHQLLEGEAAESLADHYRLLRAAYHRNALSELPGLIDDSELLAERQQIQAIWQELMLAE
ncbi:MAG: bifunctional [glutamate--ammonia ligase]-adenylyl-L-tyrosine phosphorylase/[glutamate--ammonia-ligase] adenylyltransferase, partial [Chromatiales bacterium]|nr:bifunctional [glutamate--ammonia ligase]-adenylyl-L-tyrosine phosphorylase/[glutamate--ammonia-ligase] adenylyltransferase [Chromatiales bacterium]